MSSSMQGISVNAAAAAAAATISPASASAAAAAAASQQQSQPPPSAENSAAAPAFQDKHTTITMMKSQKDLMSQKSVVSGSGKKKTEQSLSLITFEQVLDLIPTAEKGAYLQAQQRCPDLVATESNPMRFLIRDDYNVWAAARRFVAYWEARREIFGDTRAYLPILIHHHHSGTGSTVAGALDQDDWAALATGWYALMPRTRQGSGSTATANNNKNDGGHAVLCVDMSRAKDLAFGPMARSAFYIRSVMAELDITQTQGYIAVTLFTNDVFRAMLKKEYQRLTMLLLDAFPCKIKVSFMVIVAQWQFFQQVLPIVEQLYNKNTSSSSSSSAIGGLPPPTMLVPLIANSHQEILRKLESHHLTKECLPPSLGGTWSYDIFAHWVMAQQGAGIIAAVAPSPTAPLTKQQAADLDSFRQSYSGTSTGSGSCMQHLEVQSSVSSSSSCSSLDELVPTASLNSSCPQITTSLLLSDFYEALDLIPFEQKRAYLQAMQRNAALVQDESDPKLFLACEQNNPQAAARRFVNYWNLRLNIFGENAFCLPLVAVAAATTGGGTTASALTNSQVAELNSGAFIILPKDKHGRPVHMFDRCKLMSFGGAGNNTNGSLEEIRKTKLACWFYFVSLACRQMASRTTITPPSCSCNYAMHMVCLMVVGPEFFDKPLLASMSTEIKNMATTALPVRQVDIHIICLPSLSSSSCTTRIVSEDKLAFFVDRIGRNTNVHIASCPQEIRDKLQEKIGMRPEGIPVDFGGTWTMEKEGMAERQERLQTETQRLQQFRRDSALVLPTMPPSSSSSPSLAAVSLTATKHTHRRRRSVECDVGGDSSSKDNHCSQQEHQQQNKMRKTSVGEMDMLRVAIDAMSMDQKKDYLFASKTAPRLVQTESSPEMFLSFEPGRDCMAAALRITTYWKKRREIFGQDRAFSPMHLKSRSNGGGDDDDNAIMSPADVAALRQGFVACIPKRAINSNNSNALWLGRRHGLPRETWLRILFYMLHVATENSDATQEVLHILSEDSPEELRIFDELVREALPIRVATAHLLCISIANTATTSETSIEVLLPAAMQALSKPILDKTSIHMVQTQEEMYERLEWCGFCKEKLPTEVGGTLELKEHLSKWIENGHVAELLPCREMIHARSDKATPTDDGVSGNPGRNIANIGDGEKDWNTELDETKVGVMQNSRCSLDEAIELMPEEDKRAYCEALSKVPDLVEKESNPSWYLQHEKHNSWSASNRLALYWNKRKNIFGDRTFLPLNITGEGAILNEGVAYFSTGTLAFLPDDQEGRSVLCYDSSRAQGVKLGTLLELMFYAAHICVQNKKSPVDGVVLLVTTINTSSPMKEMLDIVSVFPFTWHSIHVVSRIPANAFLSNFAFWEPTVLGSDRFRDKVIVHKVNSNEEIVAKLASYGISKTGIPESCGGDWSYLQHARWQEQQIRVEWELPLAGFGFGCNMFASNVKRRCELNENERTERRRRFNVLHSRRKRERDKVEMEVFKKQADDLKRANMKIMLDNQRIEGLIRAAEAEVQIAERQIAERAFLQQHAPPFCYGLSQAPSNDAPAVPPGLERNFEHQGPMICPRSHSFFPIQGRVNPEDLSVFCNGQYPNNGVLQNRNVYGLPDSVVCGGNSGLYIVPTNPVLQACPLPMTREARAPMATPAYAQAQLNFSWQQPVLPTAAMFRTNDASSMALSNGGEMLPPRPHQQGGDSQLDELSRRIAAMSNAFATMDYNNPYSHPR